MYYHYVLLSELAFLRRGHFVIWGVLKCLPCNNTEGALRVLTNALQSLEKSLSPT